MAHKDEKCLFCNSTPADLFGEEVWEVAKKKALEAGIRKCVRCGFEFYRTTCYCPRCSKNYSGID